EAETTEFLRLATAPGSRIAGVVGRTDLTNPSIADELARLKEQHGPVCRQYYRSRDFASATSHPLRRLAIHCDDLPDVTVAINAAYPAELRSNGWQVAATN